MIVLPAIDLRGGQCVRLRQGDYAQETVFDADPAAIARRWAQEGAAYLHIVDLDGAKQGHPVHEDSIRRILAATPVPCQLGGGLRSGADIETALSWGVARVVVGTRALEDPGWLQTMCGRFPGRIVLGIDARHGRVATEGWQRESTESALEVAAKVTAWPLAALVYTDISRDGMLEGPNLDALAELIEAVTLPVIASGGVTTAADVYHLACLGAAGCIIGRALYEGRISLPAAIHAAGARTGSSEPIAK